MDIDQLVSPVAVRRQVLTMLYRAGASHLGSNMSVIEMQIAMYASIDFNKIKTRSNDRSRVIISKGHCAASHYAVLACFGILPVAQLDTYHLNGSFLAGHVSHSVLCVEHSTGALGHGINVGVGCAIGLRTCGYQNSLSLVLVGDGEIQEGSVWEAIMLAVQCKLDNFIILVDNNRISSITRTHEVIDMNPLSSRFQGFGCNVREVNGHDVTDILLAISDLSFSSNKPGVIICNTVKGKDVQFAEWDPMWHYKSLTEHQYLEAMTYLDSLG